MIYRHTVDSSALREDTLSTRFGRRLNAYLRVHPFKGAGRLSRLVSSLLIDPPKGPSLVSTLYGFKIICMDPVNDRGVEKPLYLTGTYEAGTLSVMSLCLRSGDTCVDVGANIGLMTIFAARTVGIHGTVYSFEPVADTYAILCANIAINNLTNIRPYNIGLSNTSGTVSIYTNPLAGKGSASINGPGKHGGGEKYAIETNTLDAILAQEQGCQVRMVKIDVEGWELQVMEGARKWLSSRTAPVVCYESSQLNRDDNGAEAAYRYMDSINEYEMYKLESGKAVPSRLVRIRDESELPLHDNIFCFLPEHIRELPEVLFDRKK